MLQKNRGHALLITLILFLVSGTIIAMVMNQTSTMALNANRSRQYQAAQSAAAGALEYAYGVWLRRVASKHNLLTSAEDLAVSGPSFSGANSLPAGTSGTMELTYAPGGSITIKALDKFGRALPAGKTPEPVISTVPGYKGWWGRTYIYAATVQLQTPEGKVKAGARRLFYYTEVPLFQCMFFFQHSLELYNPAKISITGLIHTNGNLYLSAQQSNMLNIYNNATFSGTYYPVSSGTKSIPPGSIGTDSNIGVLKDPTWYNGARALPIPSISAMGENLEAVFSDPSYALGNGSANVSGSYHELIEPASSGTDPLGDRRLSNIAANNNSQTGDVGGMLIYITGTAITPDSIEITALDSTTHLPTVSNSACSVHIGLGAGASISTSSEALRNALVNSSKAAISKKLARSGSSAISGTASFYDDREGLYMNVVDIDINALQSAISTNITGFSNIVYINDSSNDLSYDVVTSSTTTKAGKTTVTTSTTTYATENTVRLLNGSTITGEDGLTIASYNPVYLQGDFNTGGTGNSVPSNVAGSSGTVSTVSGYTSKPTSIVADAISLLSNNWSDAKSAYSLSSRTPSNTTYNVALLGGYIPSGSSNDYSGGAINYPRFLENWNSSYYCTYFGSMVELFPSLSSTAHWVYPGSSGAYYSAPLRRFNFDTQFSSKSPPGSVNAVVLSRGIWSPWSP